MGCATTKKPAERKFTFFPPAPDEPRIQFLTSFSSDTDLGRKSSFADFVTGKPAEHNELIKPYGIAMYDGKVYVCDTVANVIDVFDIAKSRAHWFAPRGEGRLLMPINITFDSDGTRYVADTGRNQVLIFDKNDNYVAAIGTKDEMRPCDVALTADKIYVADLKGHGVRVYGKAERKFLFAIPGENKTDDSKLFSPANLAIDSQGRLLVSDIGAFVVKVYDLDGKYLRTIGKQGVAPGAFARPKGVAVDRESRAYVVDAATQVVQIFDSEGRLLLYFGQPGASTQGELTLPADVEIDYDNTRFFESQIAPGFSCEYLILVTSQFGPNKVNVYGFLKKK